MNIRDSIRQEIEKLYIKEGASNLPLGAEYMSNAPWRDDENIKSGTEPKEYKLEILSFEDSDDYALFKDKNSGLFYVFYTDIENHDDYAEYADREEYFEGFDEDGDPMVDYGDWDLSDEVIERYVNDNLNNLNIGKGIEDWESGDYDLVEVDDDIIKDYNIDINSLNENKNMKDSTRQIVREVISEVFEDLDMSLWQKMKLKLKGVSEDQLQYNIENGLPWDWKGSKEGFYEKMESRQNYSGSN